MLPGKSPDKNTENENKFAENAITNLLSHLYSLSVIKANLEICLVGGANILRKENNTIAQELASSVINIIRKKNLPIKATSLGGFDRRSASLDLISGIVKFTIKGGKNKILWKFSGS